MNFQDYVRALLALFLLYFLYSVGLPVPTLIVIGIFFVLLFFLRGPLFTKIDDFLVARFGFVKKMPPSARRLLVILVFVLVYVLLKQAIFEVLKVFGIDVQQALNQAVNDSQGN